MARRRKQKRTEDLKPVVVVARGRGVAWDADAESAPRVYSSVSQFTMSLTDCQIAFGVVTGVSKKGTRQAQRVVTVHMTLIEAKALARVLTSNIAIFEDQIGPVEAPEIPDDLIPDEASPPANGDPT